ncbi:hypothetical protein M404DRAFT_34001 [Pisolithus tinctorius Marx 270]|uniref:Uncharacterized protein n=1 Tax=Pisolithus tinctorius Marx 270 TaxID=870435 RepID=A0A0C3N3L8_PISTI|nr:hypothetical protein M404DRAFT_34001 [Pisolithus tinctorius Marx 270]
MQILKKLVLCSPPQKPKSVKAWCNIIPSKPGAPATVKDIQEHREFLTCIHIHALMLLGVTDYKYLANVKCAILKDKVEAFEQDLPGAPEVTAMKFMLDCMGDRDSSFNCKVS